MNSTTLSFEAAHETGRNTVVRVTAPTRLRLGFVAVTGRLDRRFGITPERPALPASLKPSTCGPDAARAQVTVENAARRLSLCRRAPFDKKTCGISAKPLEKCREFLASTRQLYVVAAIGNVGSPSWCRVSPIPELPASAWAPGTPSALPSSARRKRPRD